MKTTIEVIVSPTGETKLQTHEHDDAIAEIAGLCRAENWRQATWDIDQGLTLPGQDQPVDTGTNDPTDAGQAN